MNRALAQAWLRLGLNAWARLGQRPSLELGLAWVQAWLRQAQAWLRLGPKVYETLMGCIKNEGRSSNRGKH